MTTVRAGAPTLDAPERTKKRRRWPVILAFLAPALFLYGAFVMLPILQGMRFSLYDWNGLEPLTDFVGLDNFTAAFKDPSFRGALTHNGIILILSLLLQLPFAMFLAVLLDQRIRGRAMMRMMFFAPYVLSEVVTAVVWRQIMRPNGMLNATLSGITGSEVQVLWLANPDIVLYSVFFVVSWKYFGFHMILMLAGLQQVPDELEEAASIDGASWWQTFRYITLPLLGPTVRVSIFLSMIGSLQLFDLVWVMTGGGPVNASNTMATYMIDWGFRRSQFGYASAVSVIVFGLSLLVALAYQRWVLSRDIEGSLTAMGQ
ncbi:MAG TPA: sugar ABC transporter permease [Acidimicrobiia bacterium]|nr:sugar ABC transporter permease [Acidimicrobiia bacterium]